MKKLTFLFILVKLSLQVSFAQKEDNIWVFGYDSNTFPEYPGADRITLNFSDSLTITYSHGIGMLLKESNISICDSTGKLLLVSNSCYIENGEGKEIENGDGLNPGWVYDNRCNWPNLSYPYDNNMILLQAPDSPAIYHLFHTRTYATIQPLVAFRDVLFRTKIDMSLNSGNGKVVFKNQLLVQDTLHPDGLHAVRHANGRDWWVATAKTHSNKYYLLLLTPDVITIKEQNVGETTSEEGGGEIVFSPDGRKMARFNSRDDLRVFDFDRCTGELSNPIYIPIQDDADNDVSSGLAWSADGHYLYAAEIERILQFDMWASDIAASKIIIAEREPNSECQSGSSIGYLELGPDGRIYCRPVSGQRCMHRVGRPERQGADCEFVHYYYRFDFAYKGLPHFPNFRLGPIDGSPCDTLGIDNHPLAGWRYDKTGGLGVDFTSVSWYEPTQWQWDFGDPGSGASNNSAEKHPSHTFSAPGGYEVCLTVSNQYGSDTKCKMVYVETVSSGEPGAGESAVVFSPNPTGGELRWSGLPAGGTVTARVYDALGSLRLERETAEARVDLGDLTDGVYFVALMDDKGRRVAAKAVVLAKK